MALGRADGCKIGLAEGTLEEQREGEPVGSKAVNKSMQSSCLHTNCFSWPWRNEGHRKQISTVSVAILSKE